MKAWQIVLIVVGSVLVAGGIAVGVFFFLKNRKSSPAEAAENTEAALPEEDAPVAENAPETESTPEAEPVSEQDQPETENEEERPKE